MLEAGWEIRVAFWSRRGVAMPNARIAALGLAVLVLAACAPQPLAAPRERGAEPERAAGQRITVAIRGDPKTLSAKLNSSAGSGGVPGVAELEEILNAGLGIEDRSGEFHPQLAFEVPSAENGLWKVSPDGRMETTWRIRPGAAWHD